MKPTLRLLALRLVALVAALTLPTPPAGAAAGDLDTFDYAVTWPQNFIDPTFVRASVMQPDGRLIIAGAFSSVVGQSRYSLARLNADGTLDAGFNPGPNSGVECVALQADGKIIIGGLFTSVGGAARNRIARLNTNGTVDASFNPDASGSVFSMLLQADGKIVFGGQFTSVGGIARNRIARVDANGALDTSFDPNASSEVYCMAAQPDGKILIGGLFTSMGGIVRNHIARVTATGAVDLGFNPNVSHSVQCIAMQADGKILIGGGFFTVSGTSRNNIARVEGSGTLDTLFNPNANTNVLSIAVQADGRILLGGYFTSIAGASRNRIARLFAGGSRDDGFISNPNDWVNNVTLQPDGKVLLGGVYSAVNGTARHRFSRLLNDAATQTVNVPDATKVTWTRGGSSPEVSLVTFEKSTDGGATWTLLGSGTRVGITANWQLTGLGITGSGQIRARGRTSSGEKNGSSSLIEQIFAFDVSTQPPTLTTPSSNAVTNSPVNITFTLPEAALAGSLKLSFGATVLTLANAQGTAGAHSFTFNPATPTVGGNIVSGGAVADGIYTVTLSYRDALGNPAASASSTNVRIDTATQPPVLTTPASDAVSNTPVSVAFTLPEAALAGSLKLSFGATVLTLADAQGTAGAHTFTFNPATPTAGGNIVSGGAVADGIYTVTLSYRDALGNAAASSAPAAEVVVDTTPPVLTVPGGPLRVLAAELSGVAVDFEVTISDALDPVTLLVVSQPSGSVFPLGETRVFVIGRDRAGNVAEAEFSVFVTLERAVSTVLHRERGTVLRTGTSGGTGVPLGALWDGFGVPALNEAGDVAFLGRWTSPTGSGQAVFARSRASGELAVVLQREMPAPPTGGLPADATIKALADPILAPNGDVLTRVKLAGTGIGGGNDGALIWSPRSNLAAAQVVAREGEASAFGTIRTMKGMSVGDGGVIFTALLSGAGVTAANDLAVFQWDEAEGLSLLVREGQTLDEGEGLHLVDRAPAPGERTLGSFKTLVAGTGSPGQGRGAHGAQQVGLVAKLSDGSSMVMSVDGLGEVTVYSATDTTGFFKGYGVPAWGGGFASPVFLGTLSAGGKGVFQRDDMLGDVLPVVQTGDAFDGATVKALTDPVLSPDGSKQAGGMKLSDGSSAIWLRPDDEVQVVARTGGQAAEVPVGALWGAFKSLALPARGPLLLATLTGAVGAPNDTGVWAMDGEGALRLLFREGDIVGGRVVKAFTVLKAVSGSPGVTRAFNDVGQVVWRATFTDGTTAVVVTQVP